MLRDRTFTYRGHTFEVRATISEKGWAVQVYENGKPISPPYKVTHETAVDYSTAGWGHAVAPHAHRAERYRGRTSSRGKKALPSEVEQVSNSHSGNLPSSYQANSSSNTLTSFKSSGLIHSDASQIDRSSSRSH